MQIGDDVASNQQYSAQEKDGENSLSNNRVCHKVMGGLWCKKKRENNKVIVDESENKGEFMIDSDSVNSLM